MYDSNFVFGAIGEQYKVKFYWKKGLEKNNQTFILVNASLSSKFRYFHFRFNHLTEKGVVSQYVPIQFQEYKMGLANMHHLWHWKVLEVVVTVTNDNWNDLFHSRFCSYKQLIFENIFNHCIVIVLYLRYFSTGVILLWFYLVFHF